jgi:UDP:flavonoid glycosyltransferase YjiC (YdhE family)
MATGCVLNLPEHGHLNATLPLVAELVARGDRIVYFGTEPYRRTIEATGAVFAPYAGDAAMFEPPAHTGGLYSVMAFLMGLAEQVLPDLLRRLNQEPPDYLLIDSMCVWGRLAQQVTGLPAVTLGSVFVPDEAHVSMEEMVTHAYGRAPREVLLAGIDALNTYLGISQRVDHRHGTRSPNIVEFFANRQPLNVIFTSRHFHLAGDSYDDSYLFVGPSMAPRAGANAAAGVGAGAGFGAGARLAFLDEIGKRRIDKGEIGKDEIGKDVPLIYVSLGTIFNERPEFYRACFQAFGDGPWQVIVSTGDKIDREALGPVPANVTVLDHVPQLDVLARASLCLTHGGMNTTSEALWFGVPLLVFPQHGDQHLVAGRVAELGAGLRLTPDDVQPERLRELTVRVLTDPTFTRQADAIAASFRAAGGVTRAADAIATYVAGAGADAGVDVGADASVGAGASAGVGASAGAAASAGEALLAGVEVRAS